MTGVVFKVEVVKLDKADAERRRWLPNMQFKWIVLLYLLGNLSGGVHQLPGGRSDREDLNKFHTGSAQGLDTTPHSSTTSGLEKD